MNKQGVYDADATPSATIPECWAQCEQANCDWTTTACTRDNATNSVHCEGRVLPTGDDGITSKPCKDDASCNDSTVSAIDVDGRRYYFKCGKPENLCWRLYAAVP